MKVEYVESSFGIGFDLVISISELKKAAKRKSEFEILEFILFTFTHSQKTDIRFTYEDIIKSLPNSGNVVFVIKESAARRFDPPRWCEVYSISNNATKSIVFSNDDGRNIYLNTAVD